MHGCIDSHILRSIYEYPGDRLQAITILQYQCSNMDIFDKISYSRIFHHVFQKEGYSSINYKKIFQNGKASEISVVNSYSEDQSVHTFLDNFWKGERYSA